MFTKADIEKYFMAEKQESLLFLIIGIIALILAICFFFFRKTNFAKGAAIPLLLIGMLQAMVGYIVYTRSDQQRINNVYAYDMNPGKLKYEELPRMKTVTKNFMIYRWVETAIILLGLGLVLFYRSHPDKSFFVGLGLTLAIQGGLMLGADALAERRAMAYSSGIEGFIKK